MVRPGCKPTLHQCSFSRWLSCCGRWGRFFICTSHFLMRKTKSILKGQDLIKITFTASTSERTFKTKQNKTAGAFMAVTKMTILEPVPWFRRRCQWCYPSLLFFFGLFLVLLLNLLQYWLFSVLVFWPTGMWDLSSQTRDGSHILCIGRWGLNHGTTREVPTHMASVL